MALAARKRNGMSFGVRIMFGPIQCTPEGHDIQFADLSLKGAIQVRVGVFTALLAQLPLDEVLKKLKSLNISTVELGTGNYPGDPHCKLSMLESKNELAEFKKKLS